MPEIPERFRDRLEINPAVSPDPVVKGTGVTVRRVVSLIVDGWPRADILMRHPSINDADIEACIDYTAEQDAKLPQNR